MIRLFLLLMICFSVCAKTSPVYPFKTKQQQASFDRLTEELRCMVCQNQNLADSNAELALMMKDKVYRMVLAGNTEAAIKKELQHSYGDFILFSPPLNQHTSLLWGLPFILLGVGVLLAIKKQRLSK